MKLEDLETVVHALCVIETARQDPMWHEWNSDLVEKAFAVVKQVASQNLTTEDK